LSDRYEAGLAGEVAPGKKKENTTDANASHLGHLSDDLIMAEWDQGDPLIRPNLRYCPLLKADLSAGTFVAVSGIQNAVNNDVFCCVVDCWEANKTGEPLVKVNVFREVGDNFHLENVRGK
jgi:hypothetical protein